MSRFLIMATFLLPLLGCEKIAPVPIKLYGPLRAGLWSDELTSPTIVSRKALNQTMNSSQNAGLTGLRFDYSQTTTQFLRILNEPEPSVDNLEIEIKPENSQDQGLFSRLYETDADVVEAGIAKTLCRQSLPGRSQCYLAIRFRPPPVARAVKATLLVRYKFYFEGKSQQGLLPLSLSAL